MAKLVGAVVVGALAALGGVLIAIHHPRSPSHPRIARTAVVSPALARGPSGTEVAALFGGNVTRLPVALRHHARRHHRATHKAHPAPQVHPSATTSSSTPSTPSQSTPTYAYTPPTYTAPPHYTAPTTVQPATTSHTTTTHHKSKPQSGTTTIG